MSRINASGRIPSLYTSPTQHAPQYKHTYTLIYTAQPTSLPCRPAHLQITTQARSPDDHPRNRLDVRHWTSLRGGWGWVLWFACRKHGLWNGCPRGAIFPCCVHSHKVAMVLLASSTSAWWCYSERASERPPVSWLRFDVKVQASKRSFSHDSIYPLARARRTSDGTLPVGELNERRVQPRASGQDARQQAQNDNCRVKKKVSSLLFTYSLTIQMCMRIC